MILTPRLELRAITKRYAGVAANDAVSLSIAAGEIHAVLGENGAGKSTLMKVIYGVAQADAGELYWEGRRVEIATPAIARSLGIGMVHQHFSLFETLTVAENIALATPGRFDIVALTARIRALAERYGLPVDPARVVHELSVGERQRVEILRCLLQEPRLLILDEPTSVLTPQAVRRLFDVLRRLAADGCSILYISHKLEEIRELCDRATVLRGGRVVAELEPREASVASLAGLMVGSAVASITRPIPTRESNPRLTINGLSYTAPDHPSATLSDLSLSVYGGEIVGIAGISGNGQRELLSLLSGELKHSAGDMTLDGRDLRGLVVADRRALGLLCVPEERLGRATVADMDLADNALLTAHRAGLVRNGLVRRTDSAAFATRVIERYGVRCDDYQMLAANLSGGNLQKYIIGREIELAPRVLVVAQPTWGVDVAAAAYLRQQLIDLSRRGTAVLVISEELDELFEICDRIGVMREGTLSSAVARDAITIEAVGLLMTGSSASTDVVH